jgi:NTE family protein
MQPLAPPAGRPHLTPLMTFPGYQPSTPDLALALAGGGARGAYQVGALAALAEGRPDLNPPILTGVSAGAINTSYLAAHRGSFADGVAGLRREWARLTPDQVYRVRPVNLVGNALRWTVRLLMGRRGDPGSVQGLMDVSPLRKFLEECVDLSGIADNVATGKLRAAALTTTSYTTGQTVTFMQCVPEIPIWERVQRIGVRAELSLDHVMASAALPLVFPAVRLRDGFYGDGSVRLIAPLAPAIHLGAQRIIAIAMRSSRSFASVPVQQTREYPATAEVMSLLFNAVFLDSLDADAERLERINRVLESCRTGVVESLRPIKLLMLRPSRDLGALSRGLEASLPHNLRWIVNSIGGRREGSSDFVSYLLFDPSYTNQLVELGYEDTRRDWERVEEFLEA